MSLKPDLIALVAAGAASVIGTAVLLLLHRRFRSVVAVSWAAVLATVAVNDFLQVVVGLLQSSEQSRILGVGQVLLGHLTAATLLVAVSEPTSAVVRWRQRIYFASPVLGGIVIALLLWTEPAALRETPGAWYRAASNPGLLVYFGFMLLAVAWQAWRSALRLRTVGRVLLALGVTAMVTRPYLLALSVRADGDEFRVLTLLMLGIVCMIVLLHYGIVIEVMDDKLRLDVEDARRAEVSVRNEQLGLMAEGIADQVTDLFRRATERARTLRGVVPLQAQHQQVYHDLETALRQGSALAEDLRSIAAGDRVATQTVDLGEHLRAHAPMLQWVLGAPHELVCEAEPQPLPVRLTPVRATHILTDLMHHCRGVARDGRPHRASVRAFRRALTHEMQVGGRTLVPGDWVNLVVAVDAQGVAAPTPGAPHPATSGDPSVIEGGLTVVAALLHEVGGAVALSALFGAEGEVVECWFPLAAPEAVV